MNNSREHLPSLEHLHSHCRFIYILFLNVFSFFVPFSVFVFFNKVTTVHTIYLWFGESVLVVYLLMALFYASSAVFRKYSDIALCKTQTLPPYFFLLHLILILAQFVLESHKNVRQMRETKNNISVRYIL